MGWSALLSSLLTSTPIFYVLFLKFSFLFLPFLPQAPHCCQKPQDRRLQDDDGFGRKVAGVQHQQPLQRQFWGFCGSGGSSGSGRG